MLAKKCMPVFRNSLPTSFRIISTDSKKASLQAATSDKKLEYYKNLNAQFVSKSATPPGWDEALPFEAIPGPKPLPLIGNVWRFLPKVGDFYGKSSAVLMEMLNEQYGDVVMLKGLVGVRPSINIYNPADMETMFRNEGPWPTHRGMPCLSYYRKVIRKDLFQNIGGIFTTHGEEWFKFRTVINPVLLKPRNVLSYVDKMNSVADQFVENMTYMAARDGNNEMPENFQDEIYKWSLESIGLVTLDTRLGCLDRDLNPNSEPAQLINNTKEMMELFYELDVKPNLWKVISTPTWKRFVKITDDISSTCFRYVNEVKNKIEEEAANQPNEELSMLKQLLAKDPKIAVVTGVDMLIGGIDTTGRVLAATMYFLAKHPDKQEELRKEAVKLLPSKNTPITQETLAKAEYLKAVIKEAMRISPIGIGVMRTTVKDIILGGYQIPKGTDIVANILVPSNQEKYVKRAKEFLPERWLKSTTDELSAKNSHPFLFIPFGFGPRSCIGKRIANLELEVTLLKLARNFELSWPHKEDMVFGGTLLYGIAAPLKLRVSQVE